MKIHEATQGNNNSAPMIALRVWARQLGISDVTAWRWKRAGYIHPLNVCGRLYLSASDQAQFEVRAAAGEFSKPPSGICATQKREGGR